MCVCVKYIKMVSQWLLWELWVYYEWKLSDSTISTFNLLFFVFALYVNILPCCCAASFVFCFKSTHLHGQTLHNIPRRLNFKYFLAKFIRICIRISTLCTVLNIYEDAYTVPWKETHLKYIFTLGITSIPAMQYN